MTIMYFTNRFISCKLQSYGLFQPRQSTLKKISMIILQLRIIFICNWLGQTLAAVSGLPIPGSIICFLLLFGSLYTGLIQLNWIEAGTALLISEMMLFFIPSLVGFIEQSWMFGMKGIFILFIILSGTAIMMITTGVISEKMLQK